MILRGNPQRGISRFFKVVGSDFGCKFGGSGGKHGGVKAETVDEAHNVYVTPEHDRQGRA